MTRNELPDHIKEGIEHFENHPAVDSPVGFVDSGQGPDRFTFTADVRREASEDEHVEIVGPTIDVAWHDFQAAMSGAVSAAAGTQSTIQ